MKDFLKLNVEQRRNAFLIAEERLGLQATSIEKDYWVCLILDMLFSIPNVGHHLTFKGGTSLSKVFGLIDRFSEDIDIVISKELLIEKNPLVGSLHVSNKQHKKFVKELRNASAIWIRDQLVPLLNISLTELLGSDGWSCDLATSNEHDECILVSFTSVFERAVNSYVAPVVRVDLGARSDTWPQQKAQITPYVGTVLPKLKEALIANVFVLSPERTFWEKVCLLHEESCRTSNLTPKKALSRHYYDLYCMLKAGIGDLALANVELYAAVIDHRELYFNRTWVDYSAMRARRLRLIPADSVLGLWERDYEDMREMMFNGNTPRFDELMAIMHEFQNVLDSRIE